MTQFFGDRALFAERGGAARWFWGSEREKGRENVCREDVNRSVGRVGGSREQTRSYITGRKKKKKKTQQVYR